MDGTRPKVILLNQGVRPFSDIVSSARTCYSSKGIVLPEAVEGSAGVDKYMPLLESIYQAGHHTTFQHSYLHFAIENTSRNLLWSFLHSHPFYNSEQVSQRYVKVKKDQFFMPHGLNAEQVNFTDQCYESQVEVYQELSEKLKPLVEAEYLKRFKSRKGSKRATQDIQKKSQEIARYVLPLGVTAYLHHTVSFLTVLRYYRLCQIKDTPTEQRLLVEAMIEAIRQQDPSIDRYLQMPMPEEESPEFRAVQHFGQHGAREFCQKFDAELGGKTSKLIDYKKNQVATLGRSLREVLNLAHGASDVDLIDFVMSSKTNPLLKESLNLGSHSKMMRALLHAHYTFQKKISHAADSQDQRHRMTPASRPDLESHYHGEPDYITPGLIEQDSAILKIYRDSMERTWEFTRKAKKQGFSFEQFSYFLPNALAIRFVESADLLNLKHKMTMRLCYNAQEEIWRASLEEALCITEVHPEIGRHLLPPCSVRLPGGIKPICPEGERFCGIPVWKLSREEYRRLI